MTREEEILTACKGFLKRYLNIEQAGLSIGFLDGAVWADEHPINVWHDASEEPKGTYIVLCDGLDNSQWVVDYIHIDMSYANWQDYADAISVSRWAYISDLLPKGGEK